MHCLEPSTQLIPLRLHRRLGGSLRRCELPSAALPQLRQRAEVRLRLLTRVGQSLAMRSRSGVLGRAVVLSRTQLLMLCPKIL